MATPIPLFGHPELNKARRGDGAARLVKMHTAYGKGPAGATCKYCRHLIRIKPGANVFLKCELAGVSHSEATDWRAKWSACGKFE